MNFDNYQTTYNELLRNSVRLFDKDDAYFAEYKVKVVKKKIQRVPLRILEYGCGIGRNLGFLRKYFPGAEICGCDISENSVRAAAGEQPGMRFFVVGKDVIDEKFDLIFMANVMHHIPPLQRLGALRDVDRILDEQGTIFIFEHNPYNPVTRHVVNSCPFDEDAVLLKPKELKRLAIDAGLRIGRINYTMFLPSFLKVFRFSEPLFSRVPLGGQYFIQANKR